MLQCQALGGVTLSQEAQNFQREFLMTEGSTTNLVLVSVNQSPTNKFLNVKKIRQNDRDNLFFLEDSFQYIYL